MRIFFAVFVLTLATMPAVAAETLNFETAHFLHYRECMAQVRTGKGRCRMLVVGDSTSAVESTGKKANAKYYAWPGQLADYLAVKTNVAVDTNSLMGNSENPNNVGTDIKITGYSGNWFSNNDMHSIGGGWFSNSGPQGSGIFTYSPTSEIDTFKVWFIVSPHTGSIGVSLDNNVVGIIDTHGENNNFASRAFAVPRGKHSIGFSNVSSENKAINIIGIEAWDSKQPGISIMNAGWSGSDAIKWTTSPEGVAAWSPATMIAAVAPDITLIDLDVNDAMRQNDIARYKARLQQLIAQAQVHGDVVLITSQHGTGEYDDKHLQPYIDAVYDLAGKEIPIIDNWRHDASYQHEKSNGWTFDTIHMNRLGYADFARAIANALNIF